MTDDDGIAITMPAPVPRLSDTPGVIRHAGRSIGADTAAVLRELADVLAVAVLQVELRARGDAEAGDLGEVEAEGVRLAHAEQLPVDARGDGVERVVRRALVPRLDVHEDRGAVGGVLQRHFAGHDARRQHLGLVPGAGLLGLLHVAIAGEGKLAAGMLGAFIDHRADRMAVIARIHPVENDLGDGLLAFVALAPGFVIEHFRQAAMFGQQVVHHRVSSGRFGDCHGLRLGFDRLCQRDLGDGIVIGERCTDGGTGRRENNRERSDQHAVRPR